MLNEFIKAIDELAPQEGPNQTYLDNVILFRVSKHLQKNPLIYDQCLCIATQGYKTCHLTDTSFTYGSEDVLVVPAVVPVDIEIVPEEDKPLLGLTILLDFNEILSLVESIREYDTEALDNLAPSPGVYLEPMSDDIIDPCIRLLRTLKSKGEAEILGTQIIKELYYRLLVGSGGYILASAARGESGYAQITKALRTIHDNFSQPMAVTQLAEEANMSTRAFHNHFKAVTSYSPLQYLKRVRLEKARQFMVLRGEQASAAAHMVGYESPSQFSREFKRHFGYPPREAVQHSQYMAV